MDSWYYTYFSYEEIEKFKERMERKNNRLLNNNLATGNDYRWVGMAGEEAYVRFLNEAQIPYRYWPTDTKIDEMDFTIGRLNIDVKTAWANAEPKTYYNCNISYPQWSRIMYSQINTLVFSRFVIPDNTVILLGWINKDDFIEKSAYHHKGEEMGRGKIFNTDCYTIPIWRLKPPIDIDRYK